MTEKTWKDYLGLHFNLEGARAAFEHDCEALLQALHPQENVKLVRANPGDEGVDVFVGDIGITSIEVYQCKFFLDSLGKSQKDQINDSFKKAITSWAEFETRWRAENKQPLSESYLRAAKQVVTGLSQFDPALRLASLTKERLAQYVAWLFAQGKRDSTVQRHYKFLRECYRLAELPQPRWLGKFTARYGRSPTLRQAEVRALLTAELPADLAQERDAFLLQLLLLLRDVDLRALKPHHVSAHDLPAYGPTLCVELYQQKTGEPVLIPLPPTAAAIWQRCEGQLHLPTQQERNRRLKLLGQAVGLSREFVEVGFSR